MPSNPAPPPSSAATVPPVQRLALAACMFFTTGIMGFLQPFVPLYFSAVGLTKGQIGIVTSLGTVAALLVQPVLGRLSDRFDTRRPFMVAAAVLAGTAYLNFRMADGIVLLALLTMLGVNGYQYLNTVGGVLVGRIVGKSGRTGGGAAYAGYRVWGSVGYVVVTLATGFMLRPQAGLGREALEPVFTYGPLLFFVIAVLSLLVPDVRKEGAEGKPALTPVPSPNVSGFAGGRGGANKKAASASPAALAASPLREAEDDNAAGTPLPPAKPETLGEGTGVRAGTPLNPDANLNRFLIAYFLYQFGLYGASSYLSLYMKEIGATPRWITAMFAAGVISEVLVMSRVGRWTDIYGRKPALALTFLLMPARLLLYIPATGPLWMLCVQSLHGINFGIMGTIAVVFVNDLAREGERGAALARLTVTSGMGLAISPVVCGWIADRFGMDWMFAAMSLVGIAAATVFLLFVRESHPSPRQHRFGWLRRIS